MKKNGFTLIELLAVLIILAVIMLITVVSVNSVLNSTKSSLSETQIKKIEDAAKTYYLKEGMSIEDTCVSVSELITLGYIEGNEVKNPEDNSEITGSVKISHVSNQYSYEYQEEACICNWAEDSPVSGTNEGAKYNCKVDLNKEPYTFYVLSTNKDASGNVESVNLIMYANINESGQPVDSEDLEHDAVEWFKDGSNVNGPVTAMAYLDDATSEWKEELSLNETYTDEGGRYGTITLNGKARLPKKSEVSDYDEETGANWYLYDYLLDMEGYQTNGYSNFDGYWLLSSDAARSDYAWFVSYHGVLYNYSVDSTSEPMVGVRPVITVSTYDIG